MNGMKICIRTVIDDRLFYWINRHPVNSLNNKAFRWCKLWGARGPDYISRSLFCKFNDLFRCHQEAL